MGFPIRKSPDHGLFSGSPRLIAAIHILHHLSIPGHSPCALSSLTPYYYEYLERISKLFLAKICLPYAIVKDQIDDESSTKTILVGPGRVELPTPALSERCSNQLSYRPGCSLCPSWANKNFQKTTRLLRFTRNGERLEPSPSRLNSNELIRTLTIVSFSETDTFVSGRKTTPKKGGDPAAGSPTATLLRLHPNHRSHLGRLPPYGWHSDFWCN